MKINYILGIILIITGCHEKTDHCIIIPSTQRHAEINLSTEQQVKYVNDVVLPNIRLNSLVPASIIIAQAMLESGNGTSYVCRTTNNHFGHRYKEQYIKYKNVKECFDSHYDKLTTRYKINSRSYRDWAKNLKRKGYAEAPDYDTKLINLINKYKLYELDEKI